MTRYEKKEKRKNIIIIILAIIFSLMILYIVTEKATEKLKNDNQNNITVEHEKNNSEDSSSEDNLPEDIETNDADEEKNETTDNLNIKNSDYCKIYNPDESNNEYENCNYNDIDGSVKVEDTYAMDVQNQKLYLLNSGKLYVKDLSNLEMSSESGTLDYIFISDDNFISSKELTLIKDAPENIKRIKAVNTISTGNNMNLLLITEYGEVWGYTGDIADGSSSFSKLVSSINKYEVDDIIYYYSVDGCTEKTISSTEGCGSMFKIITKKGKIIEKNNMPKVQ